MTHTGQDNTLPGDSGVWTFIIADMAAFAMFFLVFALGRLEAPDIYELSRQKLNINLGVLNTLILLTSSLFMVFAVEAAREGKRAATIRNLVLTLLIGSGFAITKVFEYKSKIDAGIGLTSSEFFMYYFAFTGIHFLHFIIGIAAILVMIAKTRRDVMDVKYLTWMESVGCYWHMVDLLWIMLFPLLYLMRAGGM